MASLDKTQKTFQDAIVSGDASITIAAVKINPRLPREQQMEIYIDGYRIRLNQAIWIDYPATMELMGEKTFKTLVAFYVEQNPSTHFNLDRYPHPFASFIEGAQDDVFVSDIAKLESEISQVFILQDTPALLQKQLAALRPEQFASLQLRPRGSGHLLQFFYPVHEWLNAQRAEQTPAKPESAASYLYIYRHNNEVQREALSEAQFHLLQFLFNGLPLDSAVEKLSELQIIDDQTLLGSLQDWLATWIGKGFFSN